MTAEYQDAALLDSANALAALGRRIGLYANTTRVGSVYVDTTWGSAAKVTEDSFSWAKVIGSTGTIVVPPGTVSNGTIINRYGIHNGSTLLLTEALQLSMIVNDGSQQFSIEVTPIRRFRPV